MRNLYMLSFTILLTAFGMGCDYNRPQDYDPQAEYRSFLERQQEAEKAREAGEAGEAGGKTEEDPAQALIAEGQKLFSSYCAACHGADGTASSPTAQALRPIPRDFTDKSWQSSVSDEHIATVIRDGGTAVGLSATMTPWGGVLNEEQIDMLVRVVREFGK